jgi:benzylsuccinate CoA-transferase BbsF subunit
MLGEGEDKGSCEGRRTEDEGRSDSWIAIAVETDAQWRALAAIEGLEALRQPAYATAAGRRRHLAAIDAAIEAWTCRWDRQELAAFLQARGVPAGAYQDIAEMVHADPTLGEAHFARWQHPLGREFLIHRNPIRLAGYQPPDRGGPLLGADTFDVLHDLLGLTPDELADAAAAGAIE